MSQARLYSSLLSFSGFTFPRAVQGLIGLNAAKPLGLTRGGQEMLRKLKAYFQVQICLFIVYICLSIGSFVCLQFVIASLSSFFFVFLFAFILSAWLSVVCLSYLFISYKRYNASYNVHVLI